MASPDHLIRAIDRERNIRVTAALSTELVADAMQRHQLTPAAAYALGRALTSGLLLATLTKGEERVTVQLSGDGPLGAITVDANGHGEVRGYAMNPESGGELATGPQHGLAQLVGRHGVVNVVRDLGLRELYQGQVALVTGEVDEDIEAYLRVSEQVPSALGCEVVFEEGRVVMAGGLLVQALPGGDSDAVREVQHALRTGMLYRALKEAPGDAATLAGRVYTAATLEAIGERRSIRFQCRCSPERITEMLALLGTVDLDEMIAEGKPAEVLCNFCNTRYYVGSSELETIRTRVAGHPRQNN